MNDCHTLHPRPPSRPRYYPLNHYLNSPIMSAAIQPLGQPAPASTSFICTSASELAAETYLFRLWADKVDLDADIRDTIPTDSSFESLRRLQRATGSVPGWLSDQVAFG
ncbi:hypothetical protein FRC08_016304 [Ceratobasidium sp. 394]|nr:hypothetical protein FRC08_016304 [Ceratobasidium sp. 394]KAG9095042.1 hypothetical protein FS749_011209 [Ceratobasidium sp. UAMH 11750]